MNGQRIKARAIILAPDSRHVVPKSWPAFGDRILTTGTLLDRIDLPPRMAMIGMAAIGIEIAQTLARRAVQLRTFQSIDTMGDIDDPAVLSVFRRLL
jgi:dihydrolipoamide dehydrogenase